MVNHPTRRLPLGDWRPAGRAGLAQPRVWDSSAPKGENVHIRSDPTPQFSRADTLTDSGRSLNLDDSVTDPFNCYFQLPALASGSH